MNASSPKAAPLMSDRTLYCIDELAELAPLSVSSIRRAIRRGDLAAFNPTGGRVMVKAGDFWQWVERGRVTPAVHLVRRRRLPNTLRSGGLRELLDHER
jgi:hypothetical protein